MGLALVLQLLVHGRSPAAAVLYAGLAALIVAPTWSLLSDWAAGLRVMRCLGAVERAAGPFCTHGPTAELGEEAQRERRAAQQTVARLLRGLFARNQLAGPPACATGHLGPLLTGAASRLTDADDPQFAIAVVETLFYLGNLASLPAIEHVGAAAQHPEVREAAQGIAGVMGQFADQHGTRHVLLRPAAAPVAETLLRPAAGAPAAETEHLLRPSNPSGVEAEQHVRQRGPGQAGR